ncbi:ankyrin-3-like [Physella acuta]|uniref:ankyrin-3-like n=1 Tax=Physella acuta TaxID=109671 RepID=UPI0027DE885D|nr:ankyrin-3-like [Physella acuta]
MLTGSGQDSGYEDDQSELHRLCQSGKLSEILSLLHASPRASKLQWYHDGHSALHVTILSHRKDACDVVGALLDNGANINAQTSADGNTALHLAVLSGSFPRDIDTIVLLLQRKADLKIRNKKLRTPYDCAIANGHYELAGILDGSVPAAKAKEYFIESCRQKYGPYIIEAILNNDKTKLKEYLDLGGDPNVLNQHGAGAIHYTVTHCKLPVYDTLQTLLQSGANANLRDEEGDTALNLVIKKQNLRENGQMVKCVQLLVDNGAESNFTDLDGNDAIKLAETKGYNDVLAVLRKKVKPKTPEPSPDVTIDLSPIPEEEERPATNKPVETPVTRPVTSEPVTAPNTDLSPIHIATLIENETERNEKLKTLLHEGAEVSKQIQSTGNTALHLCAEKNYGTTAKLLLDNNIDYTLKNTKGQTAYELAKELNSLTVVKAIEEKQSKQQPSGKKAKSCVIL